MSGDFNGLQVIDANADNVGTVEESYEDAAGNILYAKVKIGSLFAKHRLVPVDEAQTTDGGVQVPYTKDAIEGSPDASDAGEILGGDLLEEAQAYYAGGPRIADVTDESVANEDESAEVSSVGTQVRQPPADNVQIGQIRDAGDVIEIPIVEEQLVKRRVVKEVLRVRKRDVGEIQTVNAQVRKEDIEVENEDDVPVNVADSGAQTTSSTPTQ
jgi:hypothetical protein